MKIMVQIKTLSLITGLSILPGLAHATDYSSNIGGSGTWTNGGNWSPAAGTGGPNVGYFRFNDSTVHVGTDNVVISSGDTVTLNHGNADGGVYANTLNSNDRLGVLGTTMTINGGTLNLTGGTVVVGAGSQSGTLIINDGALVANMSGGSFRPAYGSAASGVARVTIGDGIGAAGSALLNLATPSGGLRMNEGGGTSQAYLTINSDGLLNLNGQLIGTGLATSSSSATIVMNGGEIRNGYGVLGAESGTSTTFTMNDDALWLNPASATSTELGRNGGTAALVLNDSAEFRMTRVDGNSANSLRVGGGGSGNSQGSVVVNNNAHLNITNQPLTIGVDGQGTVTQNGGRVTVGQSIFMGRNLLGSATSAKGTYIMNGGILTVGGDMRLGISTMGVFEQNGGDVTINSEMLFGDLSAGSGPHQGTYNLNAGTLRVDRVVADSPVSGGAGFFNWGGGMLTYQQGVASGGTTDITGTAIHGQVEPSIGVEVRSGSTIDFVADGTLSTGFGGGNSKLALGNLYLNSGVRFNNLDVTGTLDLSNGLTLSAIGSPYLLRPFGAYSEDFGSIPLIAADQIIGFTGNDAQELIAFLGVSDDGKGFEEYTSGPYVNHGSLGQNQWFLEFKDNANAATYGLGSGTIDLILFNYRINGAVPEPSSFLLLGSGLFLVRLIRRKQQIH